MTDSFGARLRRERDRRTIDIAQVAARTKIKASLFEALERNDVSQWPAGLFRRSFIRAYAEAVGLDPKATLSEFMLNFPDPGDPVSDQATDGTADRTLDRLPDQTKPTAKTPAKPLMKLSSAVASAAASMMAPKPTADPMPARAATVPSDPQSGPQTRGAAAETATAPGLVPVFDDDELSMEPLGAIELAAMRLTLADGDQPFQGGEVLADPRARWAAAGCDLVVVFTATLLLFLITGRFWMPLGLTALVYYIGGILLLGNSPGVFVLAPRDRPTDLRPIEPARAARPRHAEASRNRPAPALPRNPFRAAPRRARTTRT
jgi:transcriptional regulator with XRE-family HTH domain